MIMSLTHRPAQAAGFMLMAMLIIGLIDNFITLIAADISLWQFKFFRALICVPILVVLGAVGLVTIRPKRLWAVLLRNGLIAFGMLFYFASLAVLPIAEALAGLVTAPIFVLLMSWLVFREPVGLWRILAVLIGFAGILVVVGVGTAPVTVVSFLPVIGGLFYAMGSVATQKICADEATPAMLLGLFGLQGTVGALVLLGLAVIAPEVPEGAEGFLLRGLVWPSGLTWIILVVQAVGSLVGVGFLIRAYQTGAPSFVAIFEYSIFIFGPLFAYLMFGQGLGVQQMIGIVMIAAAGSLIALRGDTRNEEGKA
jgi:drug/metabolite transporter (DMT)-like permease